MHYHSQQNRKWYYIILVHQFSGPMAGKIFILCKWKADGSKDQGDQKSNFLFHTLMIWFIKWCSKNSEEKISSRFGSIKKRIILIQKLWNQESILFVCLLSLNLNSSKNYSLFYEPQNGKKIDFINWHRNENFSLKPFKEEVVSIFSQKQTNRSDFYFAGE